MRRITLIFTLALSGCAILFPQKKESSVNEAGEALDYYHGKEISDPFRWMEEPGHPKLVDWIAKQNGKTNAYLSKVSAIGPIHDRIIEIAKTNPAGYDKVRMAGGRLFALKTQPPLNQPMLVVMPSPDMPEKEERIVNPNLIDDTGATAIDWYVPSPDGKLVAVSMSENGSEIGDLHIYSTESEKASEKPGGKGKKKKKKGRKKKKKPAADTEEEETPPKETQREPVDIQIPRVNAPTAGGSLAWTPDSKGFYYTRYPREGDRLQGETLFYQQLYFHKIGNRASQDKYVLGKDFDRIAQIKVEVDHRSERVLATVRQGSGGRFSHYLRANRGKWQQLTTFSDGVADVKFAPAGGMFLLARKGSPRGRILFLPSPKMPIDKARKVVPEAQESIVSDAMNGQSMLVTDSLIYLTYQMGGPSQIRVFNHRGEQVDGPVIPENSGIGPDIVHVDDDEVLFSVETYTEPRAWYRFHGRIGRSSTEKKRISTVFALDFSDITVTHETVKSPDGADVPMTIVHKQGLERNGRNPTLLIGYGAFGKSLAPRFDPMSRIWLDHGGILAFAHVRGGGEFGDGWHRAGAGRHKLHSFEDFHACATHLVEAQYTSTSKLALRGDAYGGLIMGSMIATHPDLAKAVVSKGGIFDMLRSETTPNGAFAVSEFGSTEDRDQFDVLVGYSPFHNLEDRTAYPSVFLVTGVNDSRINPFHSFKMAARVQKYTSASNPVIIKINEDAGRTATMPYLARLKEKAEVLAFLFDQLGVSFQP